MRNNKKVLIVISVILILVIASAFFSYLYLMTDIFRSNQETFFKYFAQNIETLQKAMDFQTLEAYENLKNENRYESNTNIKVINSEGGEISNPLNNLTAKLDIKKNDEEQYFYADGQILYDDEEYWETEILKEQDTYGIRFSDAVKQFITIKKDENIEDVAKTIEIDSKQLETLINIIDGTQETITNEQVNTLKNKYFNIITTAILNGAFEKQRDAIITYNNVTTETNAYSVLLTNEQVENMLIEILNNAKTEPEIIDRENAIKQIDEIINQISEELEIPAIKITVYEQKQKTIRTDIEVETNKITIENIEQNGEIKTKINYLKLNDEEVKEYKFNISKLNMDNQEEIEIIMSGVEGEEEYTITLSSLMQIYNDNIELDFEIEHKQGITKKSLVIDNKVNIRNDFEKVQSFETGNNISLTNMSEQKINLLKEIVPQKMNERMELLKEKLGLEEIQKTEQENEMSQVEINKFNAKFEFYIGDEVSSENVKTLLDVVRNNLKNYEFVSNNIQESTENVISEKQKMNVKLNIEKDVTNEYGINQILEKINNNKKYKVSIFYKESNGLIDYITITEV